MLHLNFPPVSDLKQEKEEISPLSVLATPNFQWDLFSSLLLVREMFSLVFFFFLFALCNFRDARRLDVEKKCLFTKKEKKKNEAAAGLPPFGDSIAKENKFYGRVARAGLCSSVEPGRDWQPGPFRLDFMDAEEDDIDIYVHFFKPGGAQIYYASSMCVYIFVRPAMA